VAAEEVGARLEAKSWDAPFALTTRMMARSTDDRMLIGSVVPVTGVGHSAAVWLIKACEPGRVLALLACIDSYIQDYICRQKVGGSNLSFFLMNQFAVLPPSRFDVGCPWSTKEMVGQWVAQRAMELSFTAWDLCGVGFAPDDSGPPFRWSRNGVTSSDVSWMRRSSTSTAYRVTTWPSSWTPSQS